MAPVKEINSLKQFQEIINGDKVAVIDFWATWCGPCRFISPIFAKLSESYKDVEYYKVDVDEQPEISALVGIRAMPTFSAFRGGEKLDTLVGANPGALESLLVKATQVAATAA